MPDDTATVKPTCTPVPLYAFSRRLPYLPFASLSGSWKTIRNKPQASSLKLADSVERALSLRIATWNVWFEATLNELRHEVLLDILFSRSNNLDIICLQEVTASFEKVLHSHRLARTGEWIISKLDSQQPLTEIWYGTIILVQRKMLRERGWEASARFELFEGTLCGRGLLVLELNGKGGTPIVRLGTTHLEYTPAIRAAQFERSIRLLTESSSLGASSPKASVLCGDTNTWSYSEIQDNVLAHGWVDALVAGDTARRKKSEGETEDLFRFKPTFGTAGIRYSDSDAGQAKERNSSEDARIRAGQKEDRYGPRRLDYILVHSPKPSSFIMQVSVRGAGLLGTEPISPGLIERRTGVLDDEMTVWPSDHFGVWTELVV